MYNIKKQQNLASNNAHRREYDEKKGYYDSQGQMESRNKKTLFRMNLNDLTALSNHSKAEVCLNRSKVKSIMANFRRTHKANRPMKQNSE